MRQPEKWRETIDPFSIKFDNFKLKEILGYPHAGNDVFYVKGFDNNNQEKLGFLKVERQITADIKREIFIIQKFSLPIMPKIIDYSLETPSFILTEEIDGERLSYLIGDNKNFESKKYMSTYGQLLAKIHSLDKNCEPVKKRNFSLDHDFYVSNGLEYVEEYLLNTEKNDSYCFIHGDCHYANILWKNGNVTGLLDFELSGYGSREYDLAWSLVLRPGQKFLTTKEEREIFLKSYSHIHSFSMQTFNYYLVLFNMYFYRIALKSKDMNTNIYLSIINETIYN